MLSRPEIFALSQSTIVVGLVFTIAYARGEGGIGFPDAIIIFIVSLLCAGAGFMLHELMHKLLARRQGYSAEYRSNTAYTALSILAAFAGWIMLAPGGVHLTGAGGMLNRKAIGMIALAGPATNLLLSVGFYVSSAIPLFRAIGYFGYDINIWLALFNMVPIPGFDGQKVWSWSKPLYLGFCLMALVVFLLPS